MHETSHIAASVTGLAVLLLIAAAVFAATKRGRVPYSVALVMVGIGLSAFAGMEPEFAHLVADLEISPDLILYVFLPTLIFESTYNMDSRQLRRNLGPVLTLAVPGLLFSTAIIGLVVWAATPIPLTAALLLGAILSATDPVAVLSLFKKMGAPQRLNILVEGESLFNDATSLVLARILIGVLAAGTIGADTIGNGVIDFFVLFVGGLLVGAVLGLITGWLLGLIEADPFLEITLTTALAYLSFLLAEESLHVSGVMSTVGAGLTIGGWGRMKISPSVRRYLESFWEYMAAVANALIFLMVGMKVDLAALWANGHMLVWVILGMTLARALLVYGMMPLVGRLPGQRRVSLPYQTIIFWGGLRGAVALAIVLSLPHFEYADTFVALVMGAVLFTLLVQGMSVEPLMARLGLTRRHLADRLACLERDMDAATRALKHLPELSAGGQFSPAVTQKLQRETLTRLKQAQTALAQLRRTEMDKGQELRLLYLRALAEEKSQYVDMFNKGHITEGALRELLAVLTLQVDSLRYHGVFEDVYSHRIRRAVEHWLLKRMDALAGIRDLAQNVRIRRLGRDYEELWGHHEASARVLAFLERIKALESIPEVVLDKVESQYARWNASARRRLDQMAEQYPEFATAMQERLGRRVILLAEAAATEAQTKHGILPRGLAESMEADITHRIAQLRGLEVAKLRVEPEELLRKVPFFRDIPQSRFDTIAAHMRPHTFNSGEAIIDQQDQGDSLFLIARGVVRVSRHDHGQERNLGTLMAGDFFGEMALLHGEPRSATVRAVSPCSLYELRRAELDTVMDQYPEVAEALREADRARKAAEPESGAN